MSELDVHLQTLLYYFVLPGILFLIISIYALGLNKLKLEAFVCNLICGFLHRKFFSKEKDLLFHHMGDLRTTFKCDLSILEIGAGSGMNFKFYPEGSKVVCLDPNPFHEKYLRTNLQKSGHSVKLAGFIQGFAENMPQVESDTYDAVVCTLTLCTVQNPVAVLAEVKRVLKPGGTFFFLEHVAAEKGSFIRKVQDMLQYVWPCLASGCNINRETWVFLDEAGFGHTQYRHVVVNTWLAFFTKYGIYGTAVK